MVGATGPHLMRSDRTCEPNLCRVIRRGCPGQRRRLRLHTLRVPATGPRYRRAFYAPRYPSLARSGGGLSLCLARMPSSISCSLPTRSFRAVNSARTSWVGSVLTCTGRNQPIRISCAIPRASLRSVFTVIAFSAAFTCRVSTRNVGRFAAASPACSHCDSGPADSVTAAKAAALHEAETRTTE